MAVGKTLIFVILSVNYLSLAIEAKPDFFKMFSFCFQGSVTVSILLNSVHESRWCGESFSTFFWNQR